MFALIKIRCCCSFCTGHFNMVISWCLSSCVHQEYMSLCNPLAHLVSGNVICSKKAFNETEIMRVRTIYEITI